MVVLQQIVVQVASNLLGRHHVCIKVESLMMRELIGNNRALDITGNTEFTLDTLFGCCGLLQFVVSCLQLIMCLLQLLVGSSQTMRCVTFMQRINDKEDDDQH